MSENLRVLLVDDHEVVRAGLRSLIEADPGITVVGEADSVAEAIRRTGFDNPDVVVLDVRLPDGSGVEACREIRSRFPEVKVLMLTSFADEEALLSAIMAGASGYALKRARVDQLVADIHRVGAGESLLDPQMTEKLFDRLGGDRRKIRCSGAFPNKNARLCTTLPRVSPTARSPPACSWRKKR
jgi:two-component system, NarL family, response regulator DevR